MVVPALRRPRQENCEFEASLDYIVVSNKQRKKMKFHQRLNEPP